MRPSCLIAYDVQLMIQTEVEMPICQARLQDVSSHRSRSIPQKACEVRLALTSPSYHI